MRCTAFRKMYLVEARESLEKALEYDSTFAMAYYALALVEWWSGGGELEELAAKAVQYSDKGTQLVRYLSRWS